MGIKGRFNLKKKIQKTHLQMSHRKFEAPRHGSLGFRPRRRTRHHRGRIRSYPRDDKSKKVHLTAFAGFKAGMTHIMRDVDRPGSKLNKKEVIEAVTFIETPRGLRAFSTVWAKKLDKDTLRRFYKNWMNSKKKAFSKITAKNAEEHQNSTNIKLNRMKKYCTVIRVLAVTKMNALN